MIALNENRIAGRSVIERLDAIEKQRKAAIMKRYRTDHPEIAETEIDRLCDLVVSTRIRLIAESALARLSDGDVDLVLARFEE